MKTTFWRGGILSVALAAVGLGLSEPPKPADPGKPEPGPPAQSTPSQPEAKEIPSQQAPSPQPAAVPQAAPSAEVAAPSTNPPAPRLVQPVAPPADLKLSPALQELIKMIHAGVSEEVLLAYISNSTNIFDAGADQIVYLNDLGVSSAVITALIQHDASPETQARRQAAVAVARLPENIKLKTPATNVYPPTLSLSAPTGDQVPGNYSAAQPVTPPPEPTPVGNPGAASAPLVTNVVQVTNVAYFYDALAPYGNWVSVPEYGLCWQPTVAVINVGWRPYCDNGRWIWTPSGWYWYSYYSWGWAPFHYGRWFIYPGYGWLWWPDLCWGPSWVTWRYTPYYCGWAPLPPYCSYVSGFGLYYRGRSVGFSFGFGFDWDYYTFIPITHFCHPNPYHYYVPRHQAKTIYKDSVVINNYIHGDNNTIINQGIGLDRVAKVHRGEVPKAEIRTVGHWRPDNPRPERLERTDSGLAIVRPALPTRPPGNPASLIERTSASSSAARPIRPSNPEALRPAAGASRPTPAGLAPSAEVPVPRPTASVTAEPGVRPQRPISAAERTQPDATSPGTPRPVRPQPLPEVSRPSPANQTSPAGAVRPAGTAVVEPERPASAPSASRVPPRPAQAAPTPAETRPPPAQAAPGQGTRPSRPAIIIRGSDTSRPVAPTPSPSGAGVTPDSGVAAGASSPTKPVQTPTPVRPPQLEGRVVIPQPASPARPSVPSSDLAVPGFSRPTRPTAPVPSSAPSIVQVPQPRPVPGSSFQAANPVVSAPSISRPQPPVTIVPSAPARPVAPPSIAPAPSIGARSAPGPSMSAPSRPAPAPTPAPSRGSGGGVSRPSRPGRE